MSSDNPPNAYKSLKKEQYLKNVLKGIHQVNKLIQQSTDPIKLTRGACKLLCESLGYFNVWIALTKTDGEITNLESHGLDKEQLRQLNNHLKSGQFTPCIKSAQQSEDLVIYETPPENCPSCPMAANYPGRAGLCMQLKHGNRIFGFLIASAPDGFASLDEHKDLFKDLAGSLALALHHMDSEAERKKSDEKLHATLHSIGDGVISTDLKGRIVRMNPVAEALTGWTLKEAKGQPLSKVFNIIYAQTRKIADNPAKKALDQGRVVGMANDTILISREGHEHQIDESAAPIKDRSGAISGVVLVFSDVTEKYNFKLALQESEKKYRSLFEHASDTILVIRRHEIIDCNERACDLFRCSREELIGKCPWELSPARQADGKSSVSKARHMIQLSRKGVPLRFEWVHQTIDGHQFDAEISLQSIKLQQEEFLLAIVRDISDQKKAARELAVQKHFFEQLFVQSSVSTQILDSEGWCVKINPELSKLFGVEPEDIEGRKYNIFKDQEIIDKGVDSILHQVFNEHQPASWEVHFDIGHAADSQHIRVSHKTSRWFKNWAFPITDKRGELHRVVIQHQDVTDEKYNMLTQEILYRIANSAIANNNLEDMLKVVQRELGTLIDTTNFFTALYDEETGLLSIPYIQDDKEVADHVPARGSLSGLVIEQQQTLLLTKKEIMHLVELGEVNPTGEVCETWLGTPLIIDHHVFGVMVVQHYENPAAYDQSSATILEFVSGQISMAIQRKQHTDQLLVAKNKAEKSDRLKTAFLNNLSHEIRTPLNAIMGFSEVLEEGQLPHDKTKHVTGIIRQSGLQLLSIIDDIINMASIETGLVETDMEQTEVNELMDLLYHQYVRQAEEKSVALVLHDRLPNNEQTIITDQTKLTQVLSNLLQNALKFTDSGTISYGCRKDRDMLVFYVRDTGIGIRKEDHEAIFDRFTQAETTLSGRKSGVGLGLSISRSFVQLLGGDIWVESKPGSGSNFLFTIPYRAAKPASSDHINSLAKIPGEGIKVLVAEDEELNYQLVKEICELQGIETIQAINGEEAVKKVRENPDISLILMDIKMPVMDGLEATRQIKAMRPNLPIVALTAHVLPGDREKTAAAGCDDYVTKPVSTQQLAVCIRKYTSQDK